VNGRSYLWWRAVLAAPFVIAALVIGDPRAAAVILGLVVALLALDRLLNRR
jgi:hypothetical protein